MQAAGSEHIQWVDVQKGAWVKASSATVPSSPQPSQNGVQNGTRSSSEPSVDDWEIDISQLKCNKKVASGSFGDL